MTTNNGGPAFPARPTEHLLGGGSITTHHGMSLRDYFAAQSLKWAGHGDWFHQNPKDAATRAYQMADAMIAAREATE
jgi:hypothetical protein